MPQHHTDAHSFGSIDDWPALLDAHGVQYLILDIASDGDLLRRFRSQPGWLVTFADAEGVVLARTRPTENPNNHPSRQAHTLPAARQLPG